MVIFATGLGAVTQSGQLSPTNAPVTVVVERRGAPGIFCRSGARVHRAISSERNYPGRHAARAGYSPDAQSRGAAEQFGVGSVTVIEKNETDLV